MKTRIGMRALSVLLAVMLVSVVAVPAVSADAQRDTGIDFEPVSYTHLTLPTN